MNITSIDNRSDTDLLLAYGRDGDEKAFEALAVRHVNMIFTVSLRRCNNRQLAEEATQNVLVCLSLKAKKLAAKESNLTAWLHTSTRFEVAKLQRRESRIHKREQSYARETMNTPEEEDHFERLLPLLDQAIDQLPTSDREVIVRRYLEGQSFRLIGKALGISEDTAQKRTSRAFERLNLFFRKKAGITVSSTALVAGISQHCAEAAPAACLNIAGKTVSTGLASIINNTITTITTMNLTKITTITTAVVVLGGAVAFVVNENDAPTKIVSRSPEIPPASAPDSSGVTAIPVVTVATDESSELNSPEAELAKLEATLPDTSEDEMTRRLSLKHERLLKDLTTELGLSAAQTASLKTALDARLNAFRTALKASEDEMAMLTKAGGIIRGIGLREEMAGFLSAEQLAAFDKNEAKAQQSQVESLAYTELSKLTPVLTLSEEQKDRVFELLKTSSAEKLNESPDARAFMALRVGQSPALMELTDLKEANFLHQTFEGPNPLDVNSPEFREKALDVIGRQIEGKVAQLAPALDERQQQRYRDHLYKNSILPTFGIKLPDSK